jgi:hypothetical protein
MLFDNLGTRQVVADFSGGHVSSDGGLLLYRELDRSLCLTRKLSRCFCDQRDPRFVEHSVQSMLVQRIVGLAAGYEDLNDHNRLRVDPLLALAAGKTDPEGQDRIQPDQKGKPLAAASTLNRLELTNNQTASRYHKIVADHPAIEELLLALGVSTLDKDTAEVIVDLDATGTLLYGHQQGRNFNTYYGDYCYLPLLMYVGPIPLWVQLRTSDRDAADGAVEALQKVVAAIRARCPHARIIVRGDSGFCREEIMAWCEDQPAHLGPVYYCLGLARNAVLESKLQGALALARATACLTGGSGREFTEFEYRTKKSWSRSRRVVGKAEVTGGEDNPRFIVTNLPCEGFDRQRKQEDQRFRPRACYEQLYCARGGMENQIKEQQLHLFGGRLSTHWLASNQLRLWFSAFAQYLTERLRRIGLAGTELAEATAETIRTRLVKIGAIFTMSVRRVRVQLASSFPLQELFYQVWRRLRALPTASG